MKTFDVLSAVWAALSNETDQLPGAYERRVFAHSGLAIFAGLVRPTGCIRLSLSVDASVPTEELERETSGFRVHRQYVSTDRCTFVHLELGRPAFRELFEVMAADVAASLLEAANEPAAVAALRTRLNHWERFMRTSGPGGLTRDEQIGLYGELCFLRTLLLSGVTAQAAVGYWKGPSGANQDFQAGDRALEVKATTSNSSTRIRIANELQLDDRGVQSLYLFHLWLREQDGGGTTLPQLVEAIRGGLPEAIANEFDDRLIEAGYHDVHRSLYEARAYPERERRYYQVEDAFPRIGQPDLRPGVDEVEYSIDLAGFDVYQRTEAEVITALRGGYP